MHVGIPLDKQLPRFVPAACPCLLANAGSTHCAASLHAASFLRPAHGTVNRKRSRSLFRSRPAVTIRLCTPCSLAWLCKLTTSTVEAMSLSNVLQSLARFSLPTNTPAYTASHRRTLLDARALVSHHCQSTVHRQHHHHCAHHLDERIAEPFAANAVLPGSLAAQERRDGPRCAAGG